MRVLVVIDGRFRVGLIRLVRIQRLMEAVEEEFEVGLVLDLTKQMKVPNPSLSHLTGLVEAIHVVLDPNPAVEMPKMTRASCLVSRQQRCHLGVLDGVQVVQSIPSRPTIDSSQCHIQNHRVAMNLSDRPKESSHR